MEVELIGIINQSNGRKLILFNRNEIIFNLYLLCYQIHFQEKLIQIIINTNPIVTFPKLYNPTYLIVSWKNSLSITQASSIRNLLFINGSIRDKRQRAEFAKTLLREVLPTSWTNTKMILFVIAPLLSVLQLVKQT